MTATPDEDQTEERTLRISGSEVDPGDLDWSEAWKRPVRIEFVAVPAPFEVETLEGTMEADAGHILIRGVEGEFYPCDPDIFAQTYQTDKHEVPKYSPADIRAAMQVLRDNTLDHVPRGVTDTDARAGARALINLLKEEKQ